MSLPEDAQHRGDRRARRGDPAPLAEYAWKFRYPGIPDEPALDEVDQAIAVAREVVRELIARVPAAARP